MHALRVDPEFAAGAQVHARNGTCEALVGSGTSAGTAAAVTPPPPPLQSLSRVHAQLMSLVLAQRQPQQATQALDAADVPAPGAARVRDAQGAALEEAGAALHPWVHVQQVAARLQRQGNDANTVSEEAPTRGLDCPNLALQGALTPAMDLPG